MKKNGPYAVAVNESAFKEPLSPLAMYFLGIMLTDGCISEKEKRSKVVSLLISASDINLLEKFKEFLSYEGNIRTCKETIRVRERNGVTKQSIDKPLSRVEIYSTPLAESLIALGVTPRKTFTVEVPNIAVDSRDFWRGVIDGDGSLYYFKCHSKYSYFTVNFVSASKKFAEQFNEFCSRSKVKSSIDIYRKYYKIRIVNNDAFYLASILYKDCCYALPRKLAIYHSEKESRAKAARFWERK